MKPVQSCSPRPMSIWGPTEATTGLTARRFHSRFEARLCVVAPRRHGQIEIATEKISAEFKGVKQKGHDSVAGDVTLCGTFIVQMGAADDDGIQAGKR